MHPIVLFVRTKHIRSQNVKNIQSFANFWLSGFVNTPNNKNVRGLAQMLTFLYKKYQRGYIKNLTLGKFGVTLK